MRGWGLAPGKVRRRLTPLRGWSSPPAPLPNLGEGRKAPPSSRLGEGGWGDEGFSSTVTQMASSASHMVPTPPRTWKRARSSNWPTFSMNITGALRNAAERRVVVPRD